MCKVFFYWPRSCPTIDRKHWFDSVVIFDAIFVTGCIEICQMTSFGATSAENVKMTTFPLQWTLISRAQIVDSYNNLYAAYCCCWPGKMVVCIVYTNDPGSSTEEIEIHSWRIPHFDSVWRHFIIQKRGCIFHIICLIIYNHFLSFGTLINVA